MATKLEALKAKQTKQQEALKALKAQIDGEEKAELSQQAFANAIVDLQEKLKQPITEALESVDVEFPVGRTVTILATRTEAGEFDLGISAVPVKLVKTKSGNGNGDGGRKSIEFEGNKMSWADLADLKGIAYGKGSAHLAVFKADKALHDSIVHECSLV